MSKNKLQKFEDLTSFPNVYQYPYNILLSGGGCSQKGAWRREVFENDNDITLELGCGRGEYTVELARMFPSRNFIGIDIKGARMWSGAKEALNNGLKNVAFLRTDIELLPAFFAADEVAELWLTFPDPQMKKTNKRLTSVRFIKLYQKFLKAGGLIHLKTDSRFMFTYTRNMIEINNLTCISCVDDLDSASLNDQILSIHTYYEQQWRERGMKIKYLCFSCNHSDTLVEPVIDIEYDDYRSYNRRQTKQQA
jgi:tRNA (guanine-N7-)-methyltransferase